MKKLFAILLIVFISLNLYAQSLGFDTYSNEDGEIFYVKEGKPYLYEGEYKDVAMWTPALGHLEEKDV